jgi:hypothetical protein
MPMVLAMKGRRNVIWISLLRFEIWFLKDFEVWFWLARGIKCCSKTEAY